MNMAKGSGGTIYLVGLIFAILVSMVLLVVSYQLNEELTETKGDIATWKRKYEEENKRVKVLSKEVQDARLLVHGRPDEVRYEHYESTILAEANRKLQEILSEEWIATEDWKNIQDPQIKQQWETMTQFRGESQRYTNLAELYNELIMQLQAVIHVIPRLRYERIKAQEDVEAIRGQMDRVRREKDREIADLRARLTQADDQALDLARRFDQEKKRLQDQIEALLTEKTRLDRDHALSVARLESEKGQLEARIADLNKKEERTFAENTLPDGEVVYADSDLGYAWIDLGRNHGLRRNERFEVYQFIKGGRQRLKGVIEVRRVDDDMAQCAIIDPVELTDPITGDRVTLPDPNDPIVKGDLIRNPYFDKEEQKVFVFLGERLENRYYNLQEVVRRLEDFGARVDNDVSIETDFVVLLAESEETFQAQTDRAAQFGVIFMREEELLDYIGR
ncbi:hypothetical protein OAX78_03905 [Planctomycetota bacterium]|nr:hypothetical protein [Planctomycetota bacterium]